MKLAIYLRNPKLKEDPRFIAMMEALEAAKCQICHIGEDSDEREQYEMVLSVGGDGTFLSAAALVGDKAPILGVNLGRVGFLSENRPEDVVPALLNGEYSIEQRMLLSAQFSESMSDPEMELKPFALNEIAVHRVGAAMLGVDVSIDGSKLPTYWADGLLVATSSGSTAYSLSVGGPIVLPESEVLIIAPIASHNLNVRPLVVPNSSKISLSFQSRDRKLLLSMDNRTEVISPDMKISIGMAQFSLRRVRLESSNFINALTEKLFWGEDIRNSSRK